MTTDQQRIAIAQACGVLVRLDDAIYRRMYQEWDDAQDPLFCLTPPCRWKLVGHDSIPDYLNDLNAMHDAEEVFDADQAAEYARQLMKLHPTYCIDVLDKRNPSEDVAYETFQIIHTTAAQRAEAFLRTIGKWSDE